MVATTAVLLLGACATAPVSERSFADAQSVYWSAETRVSQHAWGEAVALYQAAEDLLPETREHDEARHHLALRIARVQLLAYDDTGDVGYLLDAMRRLERNEALSRAQSEDVDAMMHLVSERLVQAQDHAHEAGHPSSRVPDPDWVAAEVASSKAARVPARPGADVPMPVDTYLLEVETFGMGMQGGSMPPARASRIQVQGRTR